MRNWTWLIGAGLMLGACGGKADAPAAGAATAFKMGAEAQQKWDTLCVTCHGNSGHGDGPGAAALDPKPQSFANADWQAKVTDDELTKVILEGGQAVGKSPLMPANPDLKDKAAVVADLVKKVRSYKP